jgi:hypothetical protein
MYMGNRVTRFGEYSPLGQVFSLKVFFCKITEVAKIIGEPFSSAKVMYVLVKTKLGLAASGHPGR